MKHKYELIVGNIGTITYTSIRAAIKDYEEYVAQSQAKGTRAYNEPVTLLKNGEEIKGYTPPCFDEISKLEKAIELIHEMGAIIRLLDENSGYYLYWLNDGTETEPDYVSAAIDRGITI